MTLFTIMMLYTGLIVYICSIPRYTKLKGWTTPSSGIMIKSDGYLSLYNGQLIEIGDTKIRVKFEKIKNGDVVE
jgi:hypothetical protein